MNYIKQNYKDTYLYKNEKEEVNPIPNPQFQELYYFFKKKLLKI